MACLLCNQNNLRQLWVKSAQTVVQCRSCGLAFVHPRPEAAEIEKQYRQQYYDPTSETLMVEAELQRARFKHELRQIERLKRPGRLLDVGCGAGYFLEVAKGNGWQVWGIEPSLFAAEKAKQKAGNIFPGTIEQGEYPPEFFDLITMWQIIEHLDNPLSALKKVRQILKPDGVLVIETPNFGCAEAQILKQDWPHMNPLVHLYYFSRTTLNELLEQAGFSTLASKEVPAGSGLGTRIRRIRLEPLRRLLLRHFHYFSWLKKIIMGLRSLSGKNDFLVVYAKKK